jgi:hypothetical protein
MQVGLRTSGAVEFDFPKTMLKSDCPETSRPPRPLVGNTRRSRWNLATAVGFWVPVDD